MHEAGQHRLCAPRRGRQVVRQRSAKPLSAVRFRLAPPTFSSDFYATAESECEATAFATRGSFTSITVPSPDVRSIVTEPPWSLTILLTIASPSPAPSALPDLTNGSTAPPRVFPV